MIVLIPCKSLSAGKSRLSACLDAAQRYRVCAHLLTRTIERAIALTGAERVRVVTSDPDATRNAARCSISTSADTDAGLNAALDKARGDILRQGLAPERLMILPIDLPYATADALAETASLEADIVLSPDEHGRGTNLLLLSPAAARFQFSFGEDSFGAHTRQARAARLSLQVIEDPRIARDIDEPAQYRAWANSPAFPRELMTAEGVEALAGDATAT